MVDLIIAFGVAIIFLISGKIYESFKRVLSLIVNISLKFLSLLGIQITRKEHKIRVSKNFQNTFKDIKKVKKSKENIKIKPSLNISALITLFIGIGIIVIDLNAVSGKIITKNLYQISWISKIVPSKQYLSAILISAMISIISFSLSKLISQWNQTKEDRKLKKEMRLKKQALHLLSSKDLLDAAKRKDKENFDRLIK